MPHLPESVEHAARDRLLGLTDPGTRGPAAGWVPRAPNASERPDPGDVRDVVARMRAGALGSAAVAYASTHGHPLEHPNLDAGVGVGRRRWQLSVRMAVVAGIAVVVLGAGVVVRATLAVPTTSVSSSLGAGEGEVGVAGDSEVGVAPSAPGVAGAVLVHVVGQVGSPGVVEVAAGSRVADAVAAAGGAMAGADLAALNLARVVVDGEQIVVPTPGEVAGAGPGAAVGGAAEDALVDLNTADLSALDGLPGIGPVLAQRVLDWRDEHGRFTDVAELGEVAGIGDTLLGRLRDLVRV